ncbi:MAG: hypothetical protein SH817_05625 [Leptospira sp.]|nr:hypothetical protein [Leptospira sp.]
MADQENNNKEELDNLDPVLDEDTFSLDLDDFDLGDDDLEESPGLEPPSLDDVASFEEDDDSGIGNLVVSSSDNDDEDLLEIDLDSDLNLLGEEDPVLHDDDLHNDFIETDETIQTSSNSNFQDDLELEFDDDIIDLDQEIEAILNGEDGILTNKSKQTTTSDDGAGHFEPSDEDEEGPIALSMEELENITGGLVEEEDFSDEHIDENLSDEEEVILPETANLDDEHLLSDDHSDLELDLDDSEVDTKLSFDESGQPELVLDDDDTESPNFAPLRDPEEEELFGQTKEDENLTLSDDELGNILGSDQESLEESLGSEEDFMQTEDLPDIGDLGESEHITADEDDDGPITLSMEELENIGSEEETELNILDEEPEDETITLSPDELGSIIGTDEEEHTGEATDSLEEAEESEKVNKENDADEADEIAFDIFGDDDESETEEAEAVSGLEGEYEEANPSALPEEDDDGPLALSMDELESIAAEAEESSDEELVDSLDRAPLPYEEDKTKSDLLEEDLEDESIALSMEELENITAEEDTESETDSEIETGSESEDEFELDSEINFEPETDTEADLETLPEPETEAEPEFETVSGKKIDDLIGDQIPGDDLEDIADLPMEEAGVSFGDKPDLVENDDLVEFSDIPTLADTKEPTLGNDDSEGVSIDLDEYAPEGKLSALEELRAAQKPIELDKPSTTEVAENALADAGSELSVTDRKKVLGYLDNLLGNLPDDVIKEFSKSQYFDLYKKLMKELGL